MDSEDNQFKNVYDSYCHLLKTDKTFKQSKEFRKLRAYQRDALRVEDLVDKLSVGDANGASGSIDEFESEDGKSYGKKMVVEHLKTLSPKDLSKYDSFCGEEELVRRAMCHFDEKDLVETEKLLQDERIQKSAKNGLYEKLASHYFDAGQLSKAEEIWKLSGNVGQIKGPLLKAYQSKGDHKKVCEIHAAYDF